MLLVFLRKKKLKNCTLKRRKMGTKITITTSDLKYVQLFTQILELFDKLGFEVISLFAEPEKPGIRNDNVTIQYKLKKS